MVNKSSYDVFTTRCPLLGHLVPFCYCRDGTGEMPCRKILDCWHGRFDVHAYLRTMFTEEQIDLICAPPKPKLLQIVEIAARVRENSG